MCLHKSRMHWKHNNIVAFSITFGKTYVMCTNYSALFNDKYLKFIVVSILAARYASPSFGLHSVVLSKARFLASLLIEWLHLQLGITYRADIIIRKIDIVAINYFFLYSCSLMLLYDVIAQQFQFVYFETHSFALPS